MKWRDVIIIAVIVSVVVIIAIESRSDTIVTTTGGWHEVMKPDGSDVKRAVFDGVSWNTTWLPLLGRTVVHFNETQRSVPIIVPEPDRWVLMLCGLCILVLLWGWRKRR